jgi:solute carrier family 35 protein F1/2
VAALLVIRAYSFTNLAAIALLSTISTPSVILLSRIFLGTRYRPVQYAGAVVCVSGVVFFSVSLGLEARGDAWLGGVMAVASALVYACANVIAERVTTAEQYDSDEFLALTGAAGLLWAVLALALFGQHEPALFLAQPASVYPLVGMYVLAVFGFYAALPMFIRRASATFFNLSLLTVNIYSALANMVLFQDAFTWSFPVALLIVTVGILIYSL